MRFTLIQKIASYFIKPQTSLVSTLSLSMYQNIHKLPLTVFIDILTTKDYSLLITQGNATNEQLAAQWELLYTEYIEAISGSEMKGKMEAVKDTVTLQSKLGSAEKIITVLSTLTDPAHIEKIIDLLYLFNYPLPAFNGENHESVINAFIAYYKSDYIDLQVMASTESESTEEIIIDYGYFMSTIVDMNIGMKSNININDLSVGAYCAYINKYRQYCKSMSKTVENDNN